MKKFVCLGVVGLSAIAGSAFANRVDLFMFEDDGVNPIVVDLWVDVVDSGVSVDFIFHNDSTDGAVANIYFENNAVSSSLMNNGSIFGSTGTVAFASGGSPGSPPNSIGAWSGNLFNVAANNPKPTNGINPGETLTIRFDLLGSFGDVISAVTDPENGFRIAQHAISFGPNSIWTVNTNVPAPGALALLGLGGLAIRRRRA
jgi:hypothetical protein